MSAGALPELVDPIGIEWLRREDGWEARVAELIAATEEAEEQAGAEAALRRAERRREAAEQVAIRTRAELIQAQARVDELTKLVETYRQQADGTAAEARTVRDELAEARNAARHADDRAKSARDRVAAVEGERDEAIRRAELAEGQRDALLAERAERAGVRIDAGRVGELGELARSARTLADRLGGLVEVRPGRRRPLALPGGVAGDSPKATEFLLRAPGALVLVDGYNVAKLAWPDDGARRPAATPPRRRRRRRPPVRQRDRRGLRRRRRRRQPLQSAAAGAGDVLAGGGERRRRDQGRGRVDACRPGPVVVVTNDQAVRRDVARDGANLIRSEGFLTVAR